MNSRIETLVRQARTLFEQAEENGKAAIATEILPKHPQWGEALSPFLASLPNPSLAVTNALSCAVSLIESPPISAHETELAISRDAEGFSSAFRMLSYLTKLIGAIDIFPYCREEDKASLCEHLALSIQLAGDQLAVLSPNGLWDASLLDTENEIVSLVTEAQNLVAKWIHDRPTFIISAQQRLLHKCNGHSISSYYSARTYSTMTAEIRELHGDVPDEHETAMLRKSSKSLGAESYFQSVALLSSAPESKQMTRLANELLATLTGHDLQKDFNDSKSQ